MSATAEGIVDVPERARPEPGFLRRLLRRPLIACCVGFLALLVLVAIFAPILLPHVADQHAGDLLIAKQGPSKDHLLGTDTLGRDVLERLLVGTRVTLAGVAEAVIVALGVGVPLGLVAGYYGGWSDRVVSWIADLLLAVPGIVVILMVLAVYPQSMLAAMVAFGLLAAPGIARVVRALTLGVREELYVAAARVSGIGNRAIIVRHVLPVVSGAVIVQAALLAAVALLVQTGLAFLQLVVAPPQPSWGGMVADGVSVLILQPWLIVPPGVAIALTMLALTLLGDGIRDASVEEWNRAMPGMRAKRGRATVAPAPSERVSPSPPDALLVVEGVTVAIEDDGGSYRLTEDVTFDVRPGETVGIVGESGCGKTITASAILRLLPACGIVESGRIVFDGTDVLGLSEAEMHTIRGKGIGLISQEPMVSLDPAFRVGAQLAEAVRRHHGVSRKAAAAQALTLLEKVHLPDPAEVAGKYPHELSGGMAQRVAIARALAGEPRLLIADEPTTALDVTVQAEILALLHSVQEELDTAILLITHDFGVVADLCERTVVMYAGHVVERGSTARVFEHPEHPYTRALLASNPHLAVVGGERAAASGRPTLAAIPGVVARPGQWPPGCHFHPRCRYATSQCVVNPIPLLLAEPGHETRCIRFEELPDEERPALHQEHRA